MNARASVMYARTAPYRLPSTSEMPPQITPQNMLRAPRRANIPPALEGVRLHSLQRYAMKNVM